MNMLDTMNQIAADLAAPASSGANRPERLAELAAHPARADGAQPDERQDDEEQARHRAAGEDGLGQVADRVAHLTDQRRGRPDQPAGQMPERAEPDQQRA
jgi:hypothetical protein